MPPPAPDPTMQTSYTFAWLTVVDPSDGARLDGVPQRAERVARGHELVRDKSSEPRVGDGRGRSEEHTSELQSHLNLVCRLLLEKKKNYKTSTQLISDSRGA